MQILRIVTAVFLAAAMLAGGEAAVAQTSDGYAEPAPKKRTRIQVRPRYHAGLPPDAVRQCRAWLAQEHRPSGTVIVPRQQCWWE